jgi:hypothetical protein
VGSLRIFASGSRRSTWSCTLTRRVWSSSGGSPPSVAGRAVLGGLSRSRSWGSRTCARTRNGQGHEHPAYYVVPGNMQAVEDFRTQATRHWYRALRHRSQRIPLNWERMNRLAARWLPPARHTHPWPDARTEAGAQYVSSTRGICAPGGRTFERSRLSSLEHRRGHGSVKG